MAGMNISAQRPVGPGAPVKVGDLRAAIPINRGAGRAIPFKGQAQDLGIAIDSASARTKGGRSTRGDGDDVAFPKLFELANRIVGRLFYGTLLASVRESSLKGKLMHGGRGEDVFGAQLDSKYAEQLGASMKRGLGRVLYERLAGQKERLSRSRASGGTTPLESRGTAAGTARTEVRGSLGGPVSQVQPVGDTGRVGDVEGRIRDDDAKRFESIA